jgi:molybdopterin molybdotransferase
MPRNLGIGRDRMESLTPLIDEGLNTAEILVLSGGVSAGQRDLVPEALHRAGVVPHFQKVQVKPGKPLYFGTVERGGRKCLVFGLPGNPVSSFVCFELFVRPAIRTLAGFSIIDLPRIQVALQVDHHHQSDRPTYHPADLKETSHGWTANPLEWKGSADLRGMLRASGLLVLPAGEYSWPAGQRLEALRFDV